MIKGYRELHVWQKSIDLVDVVFELTATFPTSERYRLTDQILRAAVSIPANIAEGSGRGGTREYIHFINIAKGSLAELETHLIIARRRKYIMEEAFNATMEMLDSIDKMLFRLKQALQRKLTPSSPEHRTLNPEPA